MSATEKTGTHTWAEQEASIANAKTSAAMLAAIGMTADQVAALSGANDPSGTNVVATMADIPDVPEIPSQANMPTSDQKAALTGTSGTPSASNPYATKATTDAEASARSSGDALALKIANNLSDLNNATMARSNLGLGTASVTDSTAYATAAQGALADTAVQPAAIVDQTFAAAVSTNPYSATPALTPRRIGDRAYNTTSHEWWDGIATAGATTSWQLAASGGSGSGDMTKAVYDTVNRGYVDRAVLADTATTAGTISGSITISQVTNLSSELSATIEEAPIDGTSYARKDATWVSLAGGGDMLKSVYDTDNDGKVDTAEVADSATYATTAGTISGSITISQVSDAGDAATKDVGTTSGTVAAGDDSRIVAGGTALQPTGNGASLTGITASQVGAVPTATTVNGHALTGNVSVTATDVGLGNCDNTADAAKPVSSAQAAALALKANASDVATSLAAKAALAHTHAVADVTGLQAALDARASTGDLSTVVASEAASRSDADAALTSSIEAEASARATADAALAAGFAASIAAAQVAGDVIAGTACTLALADAGTSRSTTSASAVTITVPAHADVPFAAGDTIELVQEGDGQVTVIGASGVSFLNTAATAKSYGKGGVLVLKRSRSAADTWILTGDRAAS